ncbi:MAG: MerR family transcriptional regulator [Tissierellia bacterium]|nr:MerR family transcriptional regulator [Tissierellia bacterium]
MGRRRDFDTIKNAEIVTIGELARLTNLRYSTLKFYTEEKMIPYVQEEENLTRRYNRVEAISVISKIVDLRAQGFSIPEIKAKLEEK